MGGHTQYGSFKTLDEAFETIKAFVDYFCEAWKVQCQNIKIDWDSERKEFDVIIYLGN